MLPGPLPRHGDIAWLPRTYDVGRRDANDGDRSENAEVRVGQYSRGAVSLERIMTHRPNKSGSGEERLVKKLGTAAVFAAAPLWEPRPRTPPTRMEHTMSCSTIGTDTLTIFISGLSRHVARAAFM